MKRVREHGYQESEILVGNFNLADMAVMMDNTASSLVQVMDHCVTTFTRDKVMY